MTLSAAALLRDLRALGIAGSLAWACLESIPPISAHAMTGFWTISERDGDPFFNTGSPSGGLDTLYIWLVCTSYDPVPGMAAAEFGLVGSLTPLALQPSEGFLNVGSITSPMLAAAGCPLGPVMVASILIQHDTPGSLCFGMSVNGYNGIVDCSPNPSLGPNLFVGYSSLGSPCERHCPNNYDCNCASSVDASSWGSIKALYR
jgi:hypothetical protein